MESDLIIGLIIGLIVGIIVIYAIMRSRIKSELATWKAEHELGVQERIDDARKDSVDKSRTSLKGKIGEQMVPLLPEFTDKYDPADARFLGSPIDYIIFKNMSKFDPKADKNIPIEIEFLEVKTGKTKTLSKLEEAVEESCKAKGIPFEILKPKIE